MKKTLKSLLVAALAVCSIAPLAACGDGGSTLTNKPNVGISAGVSNSIRSYSSIGYYELDNPADVEIAFKTKEIQKVSFKYRVLDSDEYDFDDNVLTVNKSVFEKETAGDKRLRVFVDNKYVEITVRVVSKVIYTVEDFNSIRTNLNGVFVLGADIDFGNQMFFPIGKPLTASDSVGDFEGVFDGMGHSVSNITINAYDYAEGEDQYNQGPSLDGNKEGNGRNYNNGIFMSTGGSAQIINTTFSNITVNCQGLSGAVVGANGGLIKNCSVTSTLNSHGTYSEHAGAIVGMNGSNDAAGRIENCIALYSWTGNVPSRGIADWNSGVIKNCYAALHDDYVLHLGYDHETGKIRDNFDYDDFITQDNFPDALGWATIPAFPGSLSWVDG
ncbi:MAG: hypothetical protein K2M48_01690, partial [Clostridiales bacterium]|nr:hypothetical protein [Clostridiales bacterium]